MTTTSDTTISAGELPRREGTITAKPRRGAGRALVGTAVFVVRQLAWAFAIIVLVWLVVMLFVHLETVAFVLAGVALAVGGVSLFMRNRSLRKLA